MASGKNIIRLNMGHIHDIFSPEYLSQLINHAFNDASVNMAAQTRLSILSHILGGRSEVSNIDVTAQEADLSSPRRTGPSLLSIIDLGAKGFELRYHQDREGRLSKAYIFRLNKDGSIRVGLEEERGIANQLKCLRKVAKVELKLAPIFAVLARREA